MKLPANIGSTPRAEFLLSPWPQGRFDWCCPAKIVRHSTWNPGICCSCWEAFCWHSPSMRALCARPAAPKASRSRYPPAPVSRCRTVDCCCIKPPRRHNSPGWIRTARKFPQPVIPVTCRRLISRQTGGTRWSPCSHPDKKIRSFGCTTSTRALPVHSLLATATIFIPRGLPTAGKWLSLPRAAAAKKTSTLNPWGSQQRAAGAGR
jgi:hypothetical protein